jgi:hypothetical protein
VAGSRCSGDTVRSFSALSLLPHCWLQVAQLPVTSSPVSLDWDISSGQAKTSSAAEMTAPRKASRGVLPIWGGAERRSQASPDWPGGLRGEALLAASPPLCRVHLLSRLTPTPGTGPSACRAALPAALPLAGQPHSSRACTQPPILVPEPSSLWVTSTS